MMHCCSIVPLFTAPHVICPYLAVIFATITDTEKLSELTVEDCQHALRKENIMICIYSP